MNTLLVLWLVIGIISFISTVWYDIVKTDEDITLKYCVNLLCVSLLLGPLTMFVIIKWLMDKADKIIIVRGKRP